MSNVTSNPVRKSVSYSKAYRKFVETDATTGETIEGVFQLDEAVTGKIICQDRFTIVIFNDGKDGKEGSKGISECMEGDAFSDKQGLRIAYNRAMIEHLKRATKRLAHAKIS